jgi:hypothetical protein
MKVEAVGCSETSAPFYQTTGRGILENGFLYIHSRKNLKYITTFQVEGQRNTGILA